MHPVLQLTQKAIAQGEPLKVSEIRSLRAKSRQVVTISKAVFWVGIVVFNLALWVPLPIEVNKTALYTIAAVALAVAIIVPLVGLRKHQMSLELLKVNKLPLKKKTANEAGRAYIDKVTNLDRPFINAEYELLYGSKWSEQSDQGT